MEVKSRLKLILREERDHGKRNTGATEMQADLGCRYMAVHFTVTP